MPTIPLHRGVHYLYGIKDTGSRILVWEGGGGGGLGMRLTLYTSDVFTLFMELGGYPASEYK